MTCLCYDALPSSTFFCKAFAEWYTIESIMPATVNTPPIIAQIPVKKCANDLEKEATHLEFLIHPLPSVFSQLY